MVQDRIDQLFETHTTLTRAQWDRMKQTEQWYLDLDPSQQDFADRKAKTRLAINELVEQTIAARQAANAKQIRDIQQENQEREDLARRLREETEKYQDVIEAKIAEAQDHLDNRRYKEAINVAKEGQDLLAGKKGGVFEAFRKGYLHTLRAFDGTTKVNPKFVDQVMAGYQTSLEHIIKRANIGLQQRNNTNAA